ncbi:uncharacterized protein LOC141617331 [Silene latifolia]|uniref:uncharacterized protein LOC141617331 n=1 Tax=Silene latifolia TaxID=37657 RepID=UPI003D78356F
MNRVGKQKSINYFLQNKGIGLFGLLETKIKNKKFSKVVNSFNNGWCISTNNGYHSGGRIWILWQPKMFRVNFIEYNAQFIHMKVESLLDKGICYLTMVYAFNGIQDRAPLWNHLRKIAGQTQGPWAIVGDFSCILAASERYGGASTMAEMEPFRRCIEDCEVVDIAATGSLYTWNNKQRPEERIYSRIDRFLVNKEWCDLYPDKYAHFLPEGLFDHSPCLIRSSTNVMGKSSFKYLNMWGISTEFLNTVKKNWDRGIEGTPLYKLTTNLKGLKAGLYQLNRDAFSDIEKATAKLQQEVEGLQAQLGRDPDNMQLQQQEFEAFQELKIKSLARDSFLHQRAKSVWIKEGDTNSAYFHNSIRHMRNKNRVILIEDMDGKLCESPEKVQNAFLNYYKHLLGSSQGVQKIHSKIIDQGPRCSEAHAATLLRPVTGPDGYTSRFFKDAWGEIGKDVITAVLDFFQHGKRGLRQGDPLSPLIFTLCMEYLTRTLKYAAARYDFPFHPMCKEMGLTNLIATGLKISAAKSNAYFCGVSDQLKQEILSVSGFKEGELPLRYLSLPIQTTRLQKKDFECLASLFVLPKGIIQRVEATYRNFLWDGGTEYRRAPLVAWDKVCRTKEEGGLGLQDMEMWNKALVGRLVDWIYEGRDSVWVKWVECNHLKGRTWSDYEPSTNFSWVWRRICRVKTELAAGYLTGKWHDQPDGYSPASCYRWLRGVQPKVCWHPVIWNPWNIPKHSFMGWLWVCDALKTKSRLLQYGVTDDADCMLCGQGIETQEHLFFDCFYSRRVIHAINQVMGGVLATHDLLEWSMHHNGTQVQKRVFSAMLVCLIYQIWQQRNKCKVEMQVLRPEKLSKMILQEIRARIRSRDLKILKHDDVEWLHSMNLL